MAAFLPLLILAGAHLSAQTRSSYISFTQGGFPISASGRTAPLVVSSSDYPGVRRIAALLQSDLERVTGRPPVLLTDTIPSRTEAVVIGTIGKSPLIDSLIRQGKLDTAGVTGAWESFVMQLVARPFPGVKRALVIAGSDKRGTIYGMFDLSSKIGVSPWQWWADVPVERHDRVFITSSRTVQQSPKVQYRGIFINDEAPALSGWATEKFGGFNSKFYAHVYELILRMKGNYLWPAMWGRSLFEDDTASAALADEYGVVLGTSHHEPMMRAHVDWARSGHGPWNYEKNDNTLRAFWTKGIERMDAHESIVTIGMRGDGDEPMTQGANIALLERIVKDQRAIIGRVTGKDPATVPQMWALYKEVQEYYDKGMRVPDDVTLLLCDDNWGNIRKLPSLSEPARKGGYGIYYHFDYVGDPRNYKWINTNQISRIWEQMHLAYEYGARKIWIVNVGDIKPMEFPTEFFLDYAWDPERFTADRLPLYTEQWAEAQFGAKFAKEIAQILTLYTQYNSRRKPELLSPETYSLSDYREAERIVAEYRALAEKAQRIADRLPKKYADAYFQLVLHPVLASSNINDLYVAAGRNRLYARQGRASTNLQAERVRELFSNDSAISNRYNHIIAGGKWNHMMDQTHIGYTSWQQPEADTMPRVVTLAIPKAAQMGVAIEGSPRSWPGDTGAAVLPQMDSFNRQEPFIEIFNRGAQPFTCTITCAVPWMSVNARSRRIQVEERMTVSVDWKRAPHGMHRIPITISDGANTSIIVYAPIRNDIEMPAGETNTIVESGGYVSIEAEHFTSAVSSPSVSWLRIPDLGRTLSGMTPLPVTAHTITPGSLSSPRLEYRMYFFAHDTALTVQTYLSPTLNFENTQGLRYAISFDDEAPQVVNMHDPKTSPPWSQMVSNNISVLATRHTLAHGGLHVLKYWMVDPGIVLQKIVIDAGGLKPSYLGPPESRRLHEPKR